MFNTPIVHTRPKREFDGEGFTEKADPADDGVLWVDPEIQDSTPMIVFNAAEDVRIGDIVQVPHSLFFK